MIECLNVSLLIRLFGSAMSDPFPTGLIRKNGSPVCYRQPHHLNKFRSKKGQNSLFNYPEVIAMGGDGDCQRDRIFPAYVISGFPAILFPDSSFFSQARIVYRDG